MDEYLSKPIDIGRLERAIPRDDGFRFADRIGLRVAAES
jgi:hypothetical protein